MSRKPSGDGELSGAQRALARAQAGVGYASNPPARPRRVMAPGYSTVPAKLVEKAKEKAQPVAESHRLVRGTKHPIPIPAPVFREPMSLPSGRPLRIKQGRPIPRPLDTNPIHPEFMPKPPAKMDYAPRRRKS
jgi:hypothetical protein